MPGVRRMLAGVVAVIAIVAGLVVVLGGDGAKEDRPPANGPRGALSLGARTIAYVCEQRICVQQGDRGTPRALTPATARGDASPVWSPDGSRIAFLHGAAPPGGGAESRIDLYVMGADGSGRTRVATGLAVSPSLFYGAPFAWSPDGTKLAVSLAERRPSATGSKRERFTRALTGPPSDLYLVDLTSRRTTRLTRGADFDGLPAWSGTRVVYARLRRNDPRLRSDVRVVDAASGSDRLLLRGSRTVNLLAMAPGGREVVVATGRKDLPGLTTLDIASAKTEVIVSRCCASGLAWAPDASRLAVAGIDGPLLYIADPAAKQLRPTAAGLPCLNPDWSPDGRLVICHRPYTEDDPQRSGSDLVLVDPATGKRAPLTHTAGASDARWRPAGREI